jgi:hypothetical protein
MDAIDGGNDHEPRCDARGGARLVTFLVVFALGYEILRDGHARDWFLDAMVLFGGVLAAEAVLQLYSSGKSVLVVPSGFTDGVPDRL